VLRPKWDPASSGISYATMPLKNKSQANESEREESEKEEIEDGGVGRSND
jgi:hypothetical protein